MTVTVSRSLVDQQIRLRHELHRRPEIAGEEEWTAGRITDFLAEYRPDRLFTGVGGHGVIALFGPRGGRTVMVRCELDALPIEDNIHADYRSEHQCNGHKCGHDGHMAIVSGLAPLLFEDRPTDGCIALLFQPAEETGVGAQAMLADHQMAEIAPDACFALHNLPGMPRGQVVVRNGTFALASCGVAVRLYGHSSHAAHPEDGRNPFQSLCRIASRLEALVDRTSNPDTLDLVTLIYSSVGELRYGTMPGDGEVHVTMRAEHDERLLEMQDLARGLVEGVAEEGGFGCDVSFCETFCSTRNDETLTDCVRAATRELGLPLHEWDHPARWSDDFGCFTSRFPGCYVGLGAGTDHAQLHTSEYDFPDELIEPGIRLMHRVATDALHLP